MKKTACAAAFILFMLPPVSAEAAGDVSKLIHLLKSDNVDERERAAQELGQMGPAAEDAIGSLRKALNDDFPYVRIRSAEALSKIGPAAVPAFVEALKNQSADVRAIAASALGKYGKEHASQAIPDLVKALRDPDATVRQRAAHALERMGPAAAEAVMDDFENSRGPSRFLDLQVLANVQGSDGGLIPRLLPLLGDSDPQIRVAAAKALVCQARGHIPKLLEGLASENPKVRAGTCDVLADLGKSGGQAVPTLIDLLKDPAPEVRGSAARALGKMASDAISAVPALRVAAKDPHPFVATKAAEALEAITDLFGGDGIPKEAAAPDSPKPSVQPKAAAPVKKKPAPAPAPVRQVKAVKKPNKAAPRASTPQELMIQLQSPDVAISSAAAQAIIVRSSETTPLLIQALQDSSTTFADLCAGLLEKIGTMESNQAADAYRMRLIDKRTASLLKDLRQEGKASADAAVALVKIGAPIVEPVAQILADPNPSSRLAAASVLNRLGAVSAPAAASLITALDDKNPEVRKQAAEALTKIGTPEAKKALRFFPIKDKIRRLISVFLH